MIFHKQLAVSQRDCLSSVLGCLILGRHRSSCFPPLSSCGVITSIGQLLDYSLPSVVDVDALCAWPLVEPAPVEGVPSSLLLSLVG